MSEPADLGTRVVRDADVLRAIADRAAVGPVFDAELAQRLGLPETAVPVRLRSLVSLGYVEQLLDGTKDGGYTLTDRGRRCLAEGADTAAGSPHPVSG
jgi:DNA-binding IclR family transcriptional regulator